ncbi:MULTISPECIES: hypothetical protein [unclassified Aeromonas]|uniref:hypothetical protein n=1 Tax=unclassified Aeromonas TaxID=257493 RepID=UPI000DF848C9|nr:MULTISPECIES: hypothetical protein [unclassified Aeromonas]RDD48359.1 hypothetical protein ASJ36_19790 [Aeromonas sp. ARM81]
MEPQSLFETREQYFFVSMAKHAFYHAEHGIVSVSDPIRMSDAEQYGLSPLILYGLSVPGTDVYWITYSSPDRPLPLLQVLQQAWTKGEGLRGVPDILRINKHLAQACPTLPTELAKLGVEVKLPEHGYPLYGVALNAIQRRGQFPMARVKTRKTDYEDALKAACDSALRCHLWRTTSTLESKSKTELMVRSAAWLRLPKRPLASRRRPPLDWTPGAWLTEWTKTLPPEQPRHFVCYPFEVHHHLYMKRSPKKVRVAPKEELDECLAQ